MIARAAPALLAACLAAPASASDRPVTLADAEAVRRLCAALQLPERVRPEEVEGRERLEERQARRRAEARALRYLAEVEGAGLDLAWDREDEELALGARSALRAAGGALRLWVVDEVRLPVKAGAALARRVGDAHKEGTLRVRVLFAVPDDDELSFCTRPTGAGERTLGVEPLAWWYLAGGEVLAGGGEATGAPARAPPAKGAAGGAAEAPARVTVGEPMGAADGPALRRALAAAVPALEACYRKARAARRGLEGSLALELDLAPAGGPPREVRAALDAVGDAGLARCAREAVRATRLPAGAGGRIQVPLRFGP